MKVTPKTCLPLMPSRTVATQKPFGSALAWVIAAGTQPELIELVVQRLEADAEDFGGAGLVVASVGERHHDEAPLRLLDGCSWRQRHLRLMLNGRLV